MSYKFDDDDDAITVVDYTDTVKSTDNPAGATLYPEQPIESIIETIWDDIQQTRSIITDAYSGLGVMASIFDGQFAGSTERKIALLAGELSAAIKDFETLTYVEESEVERVRKTIEALKFESSISEEDEVGFRAADASIARIDRALDAMTDALAEGDKGDLQAPYQTSWFELKASADDAASAVMNAKIGSEFLEEVVSYQARTEGKDSSHPSDLVDTKMGLFMSPGGRDTSILSPEITSQFIDFMDTPPTDDDDKIASSHRDLYNVLIASQRDHDNGQTNLAFLGLMSEIEGLELEDAIKPMQNACRFGALNGSVRRKVEWLLEDKREDTMPDYADMLARFNSDLKKLNKTLDERIQTAFDMLKHIYERPRGSKEEVFSFKQLADKLKRTEDRFSLCQKGLYLLQDKKFSRSLAGIYKIAEQRIEQLMGTPRRPPVRSAGAGGNLSGFA